MTTAGRRSRRATSLVTLVLGVLGVLGSLPPTAQAHDGTVLTGLGSATIDGVVGPSGDTSAALTGRTFAGQAIHGLDSIRTVGCR